MNLQQILTKASSQLKLKNIKSFKLDSELLLAKTLNVSREKVLLNLDKKIDQSDLKKYNFYINLRYQYKPISYIINYKFNYIISLIDWIKIKFIPIFFRKK